MRTPQKEKELLQLESVLVTRLDILDPDSIAGANKEGIANFGKIDVLVINAGYGAYGPLEAFARDSMVCQFNTNVIGLLDVTRAILPHFRTKGEGAIVNISSIGGKMTFPLGSLYHGTKFAVEGISEALSYELGQIGIKVKIVEPGAIATGFAGRSFDFSNDESMSEYQETVAKLWAGFGNALNNASQPVVVAEVIYDAVTDGTDKLRYEAGADAVELIVNRKQYDDEAFLGNIRAMFDLK